MPIKLVTRADPRKLILNQTFTLNGYMWKGAVLPECLAIYVPGLGSIIIVIRNCVINYNYNVIVIVIVIEYFILA